MEVANLNCNTQKIISSASHIGRVMGLPTLKNFPMRVNRLLGRFDEWKVKLSGNASVLKSMCLDISDDSSFFF